MRCPGIYADVHWPDDRDFPVRIERFLLEKDRTGLFSLSYLRGVPGMTHFLPVEVRPTGTYSQVQ